MFTLYHSLVIDHRHRAAEQLLAAEVQHLLMVRGKVAQDRALQAAQEDYDEL